MPSRPSQVPAETRTKGAYILLIRLGRERELEIGALGNVRFPKGYFAYVGSAMSGIEARVARHERAIKKVHWHVDRLTLAGRVLGAWMIPSNGDVECDVNRFIEGLPGARPVVPGFGSSDCDCATHLHLVDRSAIADLETRFGPIRLSGGPRRISR